MTEKRTSIDVYHDRRRGVAAFRRDCSGKEVLAASRALFGRPDWDLTYDSLWDFGDVMSMDVRPEEMDALIGVSAHQTESGQQGRIAIVARKPDHVLLGTLFNLKLRRFGRIVRVFDSRAEAEAWLDESAGTTAG